MNGNWYKHPNTDPLAHVFVDGNTRSLCGKQHRPIPTPPSWRKGVTESGRSDCRLCDMIYFARLARPGR